MVRSLKDLGYLQSDGSWNWSKKPTERVGMGLDQGFIDQHGTYMDRRTAWDVAMNAGQIRYPSVSCGRSGLFSEHLY